MIVYHPQTTTLNRLLQRKMASIWVLVLLSGTIVAENISQPIDNTTYEKSDREIHLAWNLFKSSFNRSYENSTEESKRRDIFHERYKSIQKHNGEYEKGIHTYHVDVNQFADRQPHELSKDNHCFGKADDLPYMKKFDKDLKVSVHHENTKKYKKYLNLPNLPDRVDWREKGAINTPKQQGDCRSCWAFTAAAAIEGIHHIMYNELLDLSPQQLVDCNTYGNGCMGGWTSSAMEYVSYESGGLVLDKDYPYRGQGQPCKLNDTSKIVASIHGFQSILPGSELALMHAVVRQPVAASIQATPKLNWYKGGVFSDKNCSSSRHTLNHAVLVVGYGSMKIHGIERPHFIVKNSWSDKWGYKGFFYMARYGTNMCGIATSTGYPIIRKDADPPSRDPWKNIQTMFNLQKKNTRNGQH